LEGKMDSNRNDTNGNNLSIVGNCAALAGSFLICAATMKICTPEIADQLYSGVVGFASNQVAEIRYMLHAYRGF